MQRRVGDEIRSDPAGLAAQPDVVPDLARGVRGPASRKAATAPIAIRGIRRRADLIFIQRPPTRWSYASGLRFGSPTLRGKSGGVWASLSTTSNALPPARGRSKRGRPPPRR